MRQAPPARDLEPVFEAELEGGDYQSAPITSLAVARWNWAVAGLLVGALLGFLAAVGGGYQATAAVQFTAEGNGVDSSTAIGKTLEAKAASDGVLELAVTALRKDARYAQNGGKLPAKDASNAENPAIRYLRAGLDALYVDGTNLVQLTVIRSDGRLVLLEANAIATAVRTKIRKDADDDITAQRSELSALLSPGTGTPATAAPDPVKIKEHFGERIAALADSKQTVKPIPAPEATMTDSSRM